MTEKNKMLKVVSIILIVFASLDILLGIIIFGLGDLIADLVQSAIDSAGAEYGEADVSVMLVQILSSAYAIGILVDGVFYLIVGIFGVKQNRPKVCQVFGILLVVFAGITVLASFYQGSIFGLADLALAILYLIGAVKYKKACDEAAKQSLEG